MTSTVQDFLQSYFHQDWMDEFESIDDAVDGIVRQNSRNLVIQFAEGLEEMLLEFKTDEAIERKLEELSCSYIPENPRAWVEGLAILIRDQLAISD